jgi:hypothetical protein
VIHDGLPVIGLEDIEFLRGPFHIANSDCGIRARAFSLLNGDGASRAGHSRSAILSAPSLATCPFGAASLRPANKGEGRARQPSDLLKPCLGSPRNFSSWTTKPDPNRGPPGQTVQSAVGTASIAAPNASFCPSETMKPWPAGQQ